MSRYTARDARKAFERLAITTGKPFHPAAPAWKKIGERHIANIGVWILDNAPGGFIIEELCSDGGGVRHPLTEYRMSARDFVRACGMASLAVEVVQPKETARRWADYWKSDHGREEQEKSRKACEKIRREFDAKWPPAVAASTTEAAQ